MKRKFFVAFIVLLSVQFLGMSQNFNKISDMINSEKITVGQVSYLVGNYLEIIKETDSEKIALDKLKEEGYFSENVNIPEYISLQDLCQVYAKVADVKGGLMFTLTKKSARYSFKEFLARGYLPKNADPLMSVKGIDAIGLFNNVIGF